MVFREREMCVYIRIYIPKQLSGAPCIQGQELFSLTQNYQMLSLIPVCSLSDTQEFHVVYSDSAECKLSF